MSLRFLNVAEAEHNPFQDYALKIEPRGPPYIEARFIKVLVM